MTRAHDELARYLINYPRSDTRTGGGIALSGAHGSGKTHLLSWLGLKAQQSTRDAIVAYAKVSTEQLFDLYEEVVKTIKRTTFVELVSEAFRTLGLQAVEKAAITAAIGDRIRSGEPLSKLYTEGNLDKDETTIAFRDTLVASGIPDGLAVQIASVMLLIEDEKYGEAAYAWLCGVDIQNKEALGVAGPLRSQGVSRGDLAASDAVAISAFEAIAWLANMSRRPFIVLIDEVERLVRTPERRRETVYQSIKTLVERVGHQVGLVILAGTDEAWGQMRRDLWPRFGTRDPLIVGELSLAEVRALIIAYVPTLKGLTEHFIGVLHTITGGLPREIIRSNYYIYAIVKDDYTKVTDEAIISAAESAGTLNDRRKLALTILDHVLADYGNRRLRELMLTSDVRLDRGLLLSRTALVGFQVVVPGMGADAELATKLTDVRDELLKVYPNGSLVVVAVGLIGSRVPALLGTTAKWLDFDEATFEKHISAELQLRSAIQATMHSPDTNADSESVAALQKETNLLRQRLEELRVQEQEQREAISQRFAEQTSEVNAPEKEARRTRTKWEIDEGLAKVDEALMRGDREAEREIIRSLLISNDIYTQLKAFDDLGGLYISLVDAERFAITRGLSSDARERERSIWVRHQLNEKMRQVIHESDILHRLGDRPVSFGCLVGIVTLIFTALLYGVMVAVNTYEGVIYPSVIVKLVIGGISMAIVLGAVSGGGTFYLARNYANRRYGRIKELVDEAKTALLETSRMSGVAGVSINSLHV